jgi:hypothetical protein
MKTDIYQTLPLTWRGIPLTLAFNPHAFVSLNVAHMEIRCFEPLPITETGYKSIFVNAGEVPDIQTAAALALDTLTHTAERTGWQADRQLTLF